MKRRVDGIYNKKGEFVDSLSASKAIAVAQARVDKFDALLKKYGGTYGLARKVVKLPSYRAYVQKYPFDFTTPIEGLDNLEPILHTGISVEDEVQARLDVEKLESELTPKERVVYRRMVDGLRHGEIKESEGFNTESAVRYHKHSIKRKYYKIKGE